MDQVKNYDFVGYFLKRKDISNISVIDLLRELNNHLFEAQIMKMAIEYFQEKKLSVFDSSVGDWKCQTRTSMIIDLVQNSTLLKSESSEELNKINAITLKLEELIQIINNFNSIERQKLSRQDLQTLSLQAYLKKQQLVYNPPENITLLSLCFLTTLQNNKLSIFTRHQMSLHKFKAIINLAKARLCRLSIHYEQNLAKTYSTVTEQTALQQVESKSMQQMTSLFTGFKSIFKKMEHKQQPFITHEIIVCGCGGIQNIQNKFYTPNNKEFTEAPMPADLSQEVTVIEVYQFPGSLEQLQNILGVPSTQTDIPKEFYKPCKCAQPTQSPKVESIESTGMVLV
ncbi:MAG: hypothetical protein NTZ68_04400 [Candidatus Dependentiae bacterium]|nr:hypothetical protein [Candidatus Dependentiae bacterium]